MTELWTNQINQSTKSPPIGRFRYKNVHRHQSSFSSQAMPLIQHLQDSSPLISEGDLSLSIGLIYSDLCQMWGNISTDPRRHFKSRNAVGRGVITAVFLIYHSDFTPIRHTGSVSMGNSESTFSFKTKKKRITKKNIIFYFSEKPDWCWGNW